MGRTRLLSLVLGGLLAAPAAGGERGEVQIVSPVAGEPLVGRTEVRVEIEPPAGASLERVDLEVDGEIVHVWYRPPFVVSYDFGLSGRRRVLAARVVLSDGGVLLATQRSSPIRIDERVDLELQQLYVTVEDRRRRRRLDLDAADFNVTDGGTRQEIVTFAAGDVPFTAVLLVDASDSMRGHRLASALEGARRFILGMSRLDRTQLVAFSDRVLATTPVGTRDGLATGFDREFSPRGGTALRDHVFLALRLLEERQGRRAVVLLSDGWDQLSVLSSQELWAAAERAQSTVYWVRLAGDEPTSFHRTERLLPFGDDFANLRFRYHPAPSSWADEATARAAYRGLEDLVEMTGGRILTAESIAGIQGAMTEVLTELHEQYALGYYPRPRAASGEWRAVAVKLAAGRLKVRTRTGYVER